MSRILVVIGLVIAGLISLGASGPTSQQKEEPKFMSYNECVVWKMQNRAPHDQAEVSRVIHCNRIMKMYLTRVLEHGTGYADEEDARRSYYIK